MEYGDELIARGRGAEVEDYADRARQAYHRALSHDSTFLPALVKLIDVSAHVDPDSAEFSRLFQQLRRNRLSADVNPAMNWARAYLFGDSALAAQHWEAALRGGGNVGPISG